MNHSKGGRGEREEREDGKVEVEERRLIKREDEERREQKREVCTCGLQYSSSQLMIQDERVSKLVTLIDELKD